MGRGHVLSGWLVVACAAFAAFHDWPGSSPWPEPSSAWGSEGREAPQGDRVTAVHMPMKDQK